MAGSYHGVKLDAARAGRGGAPRGPAGGRAHDAVRDPPAVRAAGSGGVSVDQPIADRAPSLFAGVEPLEVFVELLAEIDMHTSPTEFYDRICEAICRLTTMRRAAIFMADAARRRVRAIGSYGIPFEQLSGIRPTLVNTPIAQRALLEDKVVVVSERIEEEVPPEYAQLLGITTLVCTPLSAGGYAYGVICADRGGGRFELSDGERHLLWTLGKTAALVAAARNVTRAAGADAAARRAPRPGARDPRARAPASVRGVARARRRAPLDRAERERCRIEMQEALADLRRALERPLAPLPPETGTTLAAELERVRRSPGVVVEVDWRGESTRPRRHRAARAVGARRGAAQHRQARRPHRASRSRSRATRTRSRSRCATTAPARAPATRGWACAWRRSRRSSRAGWSSSGRSTADRWRVRLAVPLQQAPRDADPLEPEEF